MRSTLAVGDTSDFLGIREIIIIDSQHRALGATWWRENSEIEKWIIRASIPLPIACKAIALPFELITLRQLPVYRTDHTENRICRRWTRAEWLFDLQNWLSAYHAIWKRCLWLLSSLFPHTSRLDATLYQRLLNDLPIDSQTEIKSSAMSVVKLTELGVPVIHLIRHHCTILEKHLSPICPGTNKQL